MSTVRLNIEIPNDLADRLEASAVQSVRSRSEMVEEALRNFLDGEAAHAARLDHIAERATSGPVVDHADVVAWLESWGTSSETKVPKAELRK